MSGKEHMIIRRACRADVPAIISIYSLDPLIGQQEVFADPLPGIYFEAFEQIDSDPNQMLLVVDADGGVAGSLQITFIRYLMAGASRRAVIEAMFVHPDYSGRGIGSALVRAAIRRATEAGCVSVELTSNKLRDRAHAFYRKHGFIPTHEGFKLCLPG